MLRLTLVVPALALAACTPSATDGDKATVAALPAPPETPAAEAEPVAVKPAFDTAAWLRKNTQQSGPVTYREGRVDLDGDGVDEVFIHNDSLMECGTGGCPLIVLRITPTGTETLAYTTVTQLPIGVLDTSTNGLRDIWVTTFGGGAETQIRRLRFDGKSYPRNPTVPPAEAFAKRGPVVIGMTSDSPFMTVQPPR